jgi:hypothetical protein
MTLKLKFKLKTLFVVNKSKEQKKLKTKTKSKNQIRKQIQLQIIKLAMTTNYFFKIGTMFYILHRLESELQNENIRNLNNSKKTNQNFKNSI